MTQWTFLQAIFIGLVGMLWFVSQIELDGDETPDWLSWRTWRFINLTTKIMLVIMLGNFIANWFLSLPGGYPWLR